MCSSMLLLELFVYFNWHSAHSEQRDQVVAHGALTVLLPVMMKMIIL